jgi:Hemerythrin HHE cation binding domain
MQQSILDIVTRLMPAEAYALLENSKKATDILRADHRKLDVLFAEFEKAEGQDKQVLLDTIITELAIHTKVEEEMIYPLLAKENSDMSEEAEEEHHLVKLFLAELISIPANSPAARPKVKVLSELVNMHVKEEEHIMFPLLEKSVEDLDNLGESLTKKKAELMEYIAASYDSNSERESSKKKESFKSKSNDLRNRYTNRKRRTRRPAAIAS